MKKEKSTFAGLGAAFLAILGSITCCGAPIAAGILASVGIGASQLNFLNSIQPYLIAFALFSLVIAFYRLYFKKNTSCCGTNEKSASAPNNKKSKIFLWIVTVFTLGMLIYTNNMKADTPSENQKIEKTSCCSKPETSTLKTEKTADDCNLCTSVPKALRSTQSKPEFKSLSKETKSSCCSASNNLRTVYFHINGMASQCCIKPFIKKLKAQPGIKFYNIGADKKVIGIKYNKKEITLDQLKQLITDARYEITQTK